MKENWSKPGGQMFDVSGQRAQKLSGFANDGDDLARRLVLQIFDAGEALPAFVHMIAHERLAEIARLVAKFVRFQ